jgi:hypothetical protein
MKPTTVAMALATLTGCIGAPFTELSSSPSSDDAGALEASTLAPEASTSLEAKGERFEAGGIDPPGIDPPDVSFDSPTSPADALASPADASLCTAIPFEARSNCPASGSAGCTSCSDPLLYAPAGFWYVDSSLVCTQVETPAACQCAETYDCACLVAALGPSCKGTVVCDADVTAPALFARCVESGE